MAGSSCPLKRLASSRGFKRLNLLHQFVETFKTKIASTLLRSHATQHTYSQNAFFQTYMDMELLAD